MNRAQCNLHKRLWLRSACVLWLIWLVAGTVGAQIEEVDLPPENYQQIAYESLSLAELEERFRTAETTFLEASDLAQASPLFSELIETLTSRDSDDPTEKSLLSRSLGYRARASFNLGNDDTMTADLLRLIAVDPGFEFDSALVSPKLLNQFSSLKKERVGFLQLTVSPADTEVRVAGRLLDLSRPSVAVPAGPLTVTATRPGYADIEMPLEIRGGREIPLDLTLERNSAMILLVSRPPGAQVIINEMEIGITGGVLPDDYPLADSPADADRKEYSAPLRVGDLQPGVHRIEVLKEGYRPHRFQVNVPELKDYNAGVADLERTEGTILLRGLPRKAVVQVDDQAVQPVPVNSTDGRLLLPPGDYRLGVKDGTSGFFETHVSVRDAKTSEIDIRLRPALTLLGVLGGDRPAANKLMASLSQQSANLDNWTFLDRSDAGEQLARQSGFEASALRRLAAGPSGTGSEVAPNWLSLQKEADRTAPGSVYVLAVLSDDLIADFVDLWFLPTAPAPAWPDRQRLALDKEAAIPSLFEAFDNPFASQRAWFGAGLLDSGAAEGPVVVYLDPQGPAAKAGVLLGDTILTVSGEPVSTVGEVQKSLESLRPGSSFSVELANVAGRRTLDVQLGSSPAVIPLDSPDLIYAVVAAAVASESNDRESTTPAWLLSLNQAAVFLHGGAWEDAVRVLRGIRAPQGPGLGQAAVDYWLATALRAIGPEYYDQAKEALERAAAVSGARLFHNDGPLVAPRARARLQDLVSSR